MKNDIFKKFLSFLSLIALLFSFAWVSAFTTLQPINWINTIKPINTVTKYTSFKAIKPVYNPKIMMDKKVGSFAINSKKILNKQVLELVPITASNAWKIMNTWTVSNNFSKNFIVKPVWSKFESLVLRLDQKWLTEALSRTNEMKSVYARYKNKGLWKLEIQIPKLQRLPDRLVLTSKSKIKFKTKAEFDNIKKYYKLDKKTVYQALSNKVKLKNKNFMAPKVNFGQEDFYADFYKWCMRVSTCRTWLLKKLPKKTASKWSYLSRKYSSGDNLAIENFIFTNEEESEMISEEKIEISLLPVNPLSSVNFNYNLRKTPGLVRISGTKINSVFKDLQLVAKINTDILDAINERTQLIDKVDKICKSYTWNEKTACEKLASEYLNPKDKSYEKILINGITLGNEYRYSYYTSWTKTFLGREVKIYEVDISLEFGYGFGIRIPIKVKVNIDKSTIPKDTLNKKYKASIEVKTINANAQQYRDAWIHSTQIFGWKEFVFTVYANLYWKLVLVNHTVFNETYDLIELLWKLLNINWMHSFDKSKDFTPPFAWNNLIWLLNKEFWVPVYWKNYSVWWWTLYADILFQVYIDWYIKAYCKTLNSFWWSCNRDLEFRSVAPKILELTPILNNNTKKTNELWEYNEYWIILKDFRYIPQLVTAIKTRARLNRWYDIKLRDDDGDVSSPRYEVYKFTLDLPELWAHVWYWEWWRYELTEEQKQISATDNKYYSKLKTVIDSSVWKYYPELSAWFGKQDIWRADLWKKIPWEIDFWEIPWKKPWKWDIGKNPWKWDIPWRIPWNWNSNNDNWQAEVWNNNWWQNSPVWENDENDEYPWVEWTPSWEDSAWDDYYPWVEWRPSEDQEEVIPDDVTDFSRGWLLSWEWIYPEDLELRFVPKTAIDFVINFFEKRTPAKRAKLYSQILMMLETYENNEKLRVKKAKLINILKDLRDIMVVYRLR